MPATFNQLSQIIDAIHRSPQMVVLEFAGAGALALAWLHRVGGSSRTVLEATDRYASRSLIEAVGFTPTQFTAPDVAEAMATRAYIRAGQLVNSGTPVVGVGCTATISTDRVKWGEHRCCISVCDARGVTTYSLTLSKGLRTRDEEERLVSLMIIRAIARACQINDPLPMELTAKERVHESFEPFDLLDRLLAGQVESVLVMPDGQMLGGNRRQNLALLSGAFNPLHQGHRKLAGIAAEILQQEVYFELPLVNADKAPIADSEAARRRIAQFEGIAPVLVTRAPLFSQKARLCPNSTFILGIDTVERLVQARFYHNSRAKMLASLEAVQAAGCHFLVAGRVRDNHFVTLADVELPDEYRDLFREIPEDRFRVDISSTAIRQNQITDKPE